MTDETTANDQDAKTLSPIFPDEIEQAAVALLETCCDGDLTLATAESCTGGLLASLLTDVEGASHAFERGFVTYSAESKCELLGIARQDIDSCGAVSRDVAIAMADGVIRRSRADVALSVTGYAGTAPDGDEAGLVHFACIRRGGKTLHREEHFGDIGRGPIRIGAIRVAIEMMRQAVG